MSDSEENPLTNSVKDGNYYKTARSWYSDVYHAPIAERSYYIITVTLALICLYCSLAALLRLYPINAPVSLTIYSGDIWEERPRIQKLADSPKEDKNVAVMRYMITDYVKKYESYNLPEYKFRYLNVWSHSSPSVFDEYKNEIDANNPASPYRQFTDQAVREIDIRSLHYDISQRPFHAEVTFTASIVDNATRKETQNTSWRAYITYDYTSFDVGGNAGGKKPHSPFLGLTGEVTKGSGETKDIIPMTFTVSEYKVKELMNENN